MGLSLLGTECYRVLLGFSFKVSVLSGPVGPSDLERVRYRVGNRVLFCCRFGSFFFFFFFALLPAGCRTRDPNLPAGIDSAPSTRVGFTLSTGFLPSFTEFYRVLPSFFEDNGTDMEARELMECFVHY